MRRVYSKGWFALASQCAIMFTRDFSVIVTSVSCKVFGLRYEEGSSENETFSNDLS